MSDEDDSEFEIVDHTQKIPKDTQQLILYESAHILELRKEIEELRGKLNNVFWTNVVFRTINLVINPVEIARGHVKDVLFYTVTKLVAYL